MHTGIESVSQLANKSLNDYSNQSKNLHRESTETMLPVFDHSHLDDIYVPSPINAGKRYKKKQL